MLKGNLIQKYKTLPQAKAIPDILWDAQNMLDRIKILQEEIKSIREKFCWNIEPKVMAILRQNWNDDELDRAGFIEKYCKCFYTGAAVISSPIDTIETCRICGKIRKDK
uniref:Uncharacterized protein n=1 Tax=viral metagenome TaxID=1070528 RepID=A0A6H1Z9M3_9ZZZZ